MLATLGRQHLQVYLNVEQRPLKSLDVGSSPSTCAKKLAGFMRAATHPQKLLVSRCATSRLDCSRAGRVHEG